MSRLLRALVMTMTVASLGAAQTKTCEETCEPKQKAAVKCSTMECICYSYDDPDFVSCLQAECGRGYSSVREIQVLSCSYMGVTLTPDPPTAAGAGTQTTTGASNPQATGAGTGTGTSNTTPGGNGGGSSSAGPGSGSGSDSSSASNQSSTGKDRLSTAELIGIVIGSVSALATIIGVWVTIKKRKARGPTLAPTFVSGYQPIPPPAPTYPPAQNIHVAPIYNGPPPRYQPPPAYHTVHVGWRK
ncbi:hypothetical protein B0T16DRAFT_493977 [Cercophora newfieldiana]|uniref:Extracellular membrane protein CFEM domain-containing protein n=1 Tax=Cercophora newfieldiana TaxID=92897 RepID=A0AA39Y6V7_9PEZI|nr:hypothetical protein B0T16DRAFT_493977 [Cercophora newfieldiana]